MAKKIQPDTVSNTAWIDISEASKVGYWQFATGCYKLNIEYKPSDKYTFQADFAVRNEDGSVTLNSVFRNKTNAQLKIVKTIITNWKDYSNAEINTKNTVGNMVVPGQIKNGAVYSSYEDMIFDSSNADEYLSGSLKNDIYHLTKTTPAGSKDVIFDEKGNEIYNVYNGTNTTSNNRFYDLAGNDKYNLMSKKTGDAYDFVEDFAGNDRYTLLNNTNVEVNELAGNDNYAVKEKSKLTVTDYLGNDKYVANMAEIDVTDEKGNDSYDISNTKKTSTLTTVFATNDFYGAGNAYNDSNWADSAKSFVNILDKAGNDKYTISNIIESTNAANPIIQDYTGNDKYTVTGVRNLIIRENDNDYIGTFEGYKAKDVQATAQYDKKNDTSVESQNKSGNDIYNISASERITIYETSSNSGNDTYNLDSLNIYNLDETGNDNNAYIYDNAGADKYNIKNSRTIHITDKAGVDTYNIQDTDRLVIGDTDTSLKGGDKYNLKGVTGGYTFSSISDANGSEKYTISDGTSNLRITDNGGADNYNVKDSRDVMIVDSSANNSKNINDKYAFSDYFGTSFDVSSITDDKGNETYAFNNVNTLKVADDSGSDTYTVKNSNNIKIIDKSSTPENPKKAEKNKFNFTNCTNIDITTGTTMRPNAYSVDTYNMTSTTFNITENDKAGDIYNITIPKTKGTPKAANISNTSSIVDKGGDDSYKVSSITYGLKIDDKTGSDELIIQNAKLDNLVFMANKNWTGDSYNHENTLYIYDKSTKGYISIANFFAGGNEYGVSDKNAQNETIRGDGLIEKIKIGGKSFEVTSGIITKINNGTGTEAGELYNAIGSWIKTSDFNNIGEILDSGNQLYIKPLVEAFENGTANNLPTP